ncbi:MAG: hypothetical protein JW776_16115 [Candidatus Lokiarchaeota archaeon]|nr:hypothetical protein [Candidatus Lokiarchaeota archaeon]
MEHSYWIFRSPEHNVSIEKVPIYFQQVDLQGDSKAGKVIFESYNQMEEIFGPDAIIEVYWETIDRSIFHQGNRVQQSFDMYNAIEVNITKKETRWNRSHENSYWYGTRKQIIQKRFYTSKHIHCIVLCDLTDRVFEIHAKIIANLYPNYENLVQETIASLLCHEV